MLSAEFIENSVSPVSDLNCQISMLAFLAEITETSVFFSFVSASKLLLYAPYMFCRTGDA